MSAPNVTVLYDAPGPRARRRSLIGSVVVTVVILVLAAVVVVRLADQRQLDAELWAPYVDPTSENFEAVWTLLWEGLQATLTAAVLAIVLSLAIGTLLAVARMMLGRWGRLPLIGLIELLRGLPVVVSIYFAWRVLPELGVNVGPLPGDDGLWYLIVGLTAYNMVIIAEIVRAGVLSLPSGQREAGLALGMTPWQTMREIQLPQAFRTMLPALISQLVVILKDTSLAAVLGLYLELLRRGQLVATRLDNPIQTFFVVGLIFVVLNFVLSQVAVWVERRTSRRTVGKAAAATAESEASTGA
ncbi:MAG: amino acid ABC transporter permease [Actinomycetota bacterium]